MDGIDVDLNNDNDNDSGGELRAEEATGLVTVRVRSGRYNVISLIQVADGYPMEGCGVELRSHNFPEHVARRHLVQVLPCHVMPCCTVPCLTVSRWVVVAFIVLLHICTFNTPSTFSR